MMRVRQILLPALPAIQGEIPVALVLVVGALFLALLWGIMIRQVESEREEALLDIYRAQQALAARVIEHFNETISIGDQFVRVVREEILSGRFDRKQFYNGIALVNGDGHVETYPHLPVRRFEGDEDYFVRQKASSKDNFFLDVLDQGQNGRQPALFISRKITMNDGSFGGVVKVKLAQEFFSRYLDKLGLPHTQTILLVKDDGTVLGSYPVAGAEGEAPPELDSLLTALTNTQTGTMKTARPVEHGRRFWTAWPVPDHRMLALVGDAASSMDHFRDSAKKYYFTGVAISTLIALVTLTIAWLTWKVNKFVLLLRDNEHRANAANSLKSSFVAKISHDLRTPLNGIIGFADLLRQTSAVERDKTYAGHIYASATHLHCLLNMILDITKIEAGAEVLNKSDVELVPVIRNLAEIHSVAAAQKGIALVLEIERDTPFILHCDELRLRQILGNVLHNAVKFTERGRVCFTVGKSQDGVVFTISDSGPGISREDQSQLFSIFHHAENELSRKGAGSGLGLAITKELVDLHGGKIHVDTAVGVGTTFTIVLPE